LAEVLIAPEQQRHITFSAFFANTMFHEVAHGLGIKNTINRRGTVREALKDNASAPEEGKADVLGFYMVTQLHEQGDGDYEGVAQLVSSRGVSDDQLQQDLDWLEAQNIPVDVVFKQGLDVLGLSAER
jgi:hypothetical protein